MLSVSCMYVCVNSNECVSKMHAVGWWTLCNLICCSPHLISALLSPNAYVCVLCTYTYIHTYICILIHLISYICSMIVLYQQCVVCLFLLLYMRTHVWYSMYVCTSHFSPLYSVQSSSLSLCGPWATSPTCWPTGLLCQELSGAAIVPLLS